MKILFITTHNLATNPRLYKEVILAIEKGFEVEMICFEFNNWSKLSNEKLLSKLKDVKIIVIPSGRNPLLPWFWSIFTEKFFRLLSTILLLSAPKLSQAVSRRSNLLINSLKKVSKPDLVIGHNPGALWPAIRASHIFKCRVGFDVEDYHPGEGNNKNLQNNTKRLMVKLLPELDYISFAAPLILEQVKEDLKYENKDWFTILNLFPAHEFMVPTKQNHNKIRLVWFSQNINKDRGLELILPFIKKENATVELHLIGNLNQDFFKDHLADNANIIIHAPMEQKELHHALSNFDIGLALDIPVDLNRELAITNKLIAYLQAGLYVFASDTTAQLSFLKDHQDHGICFDHKINNSDIVLNDLIKNIDKIRSNRERRYNNFINSNWETASDKLVSVWNNNLGD